jgi:tetratricopeptide (TPR) repeat protein
MKRTGFFVSRVRGAAGFAGMIALAVAPRPAAAQTQAEHWQKCTGQEVQAAIDGCTAIIQAGGEKPTDLAAAYYNRGTARGKIFAVNLAIQDFDQAIKLNPHQAPVFNNRGLLYRLKGEYDRALQDLNEALRLDSAYGPAWFNRGLTYMKQGEYDRAITDYDAALALDPQNAMSLFARGKAKQGKGDTAGAEADIAAAKALQPDIAP